MKKIVIIALAPAFDRFGLLRRVSIHVVWVVLCFCLFLHFPDARHAANATLLGKTETTAPATLINLVRIVKAIRIDMHKGRSITFRSPFPIRVYSPKRAVALDVCV